ncbi:hypothetical protein [Pedobacter sp. UYP30]|uniref:hypothetical protein n=1 Tax=Pedobacter sp. UYP30 TaxID=1756400 RepID=UPI003398CCD8
MKKSFKILSLLILSSSVLITSCKKSDPIAPAAPSGDSNWKFGDYTYIRAASSQKSQTNDSKTLTVIAVSTAGVGTYGAFSGSGLTLSFYSNLGVGKYNLGNTELLVSNPGTKILDVSCTIGTAVNTGATLYTPNALSTDVTADITKDANGQYHVALSKPVTLFKDVVVGGGVPNAANSYELTINNAY